MKKRVFLFLIVGLFVLSTTACDKKKEDTKKPYVKPNALETAENGEHHQLKLDDQRYIVKSSLVNDMYLKDITLNSDKSAYRNDCVDEANCDSYKGTYYFQGDTIVINYHEKCHTEEDWNVLEEDISITYNITDTNVFKSDTDVYEIEK